MAEQELREQIIARLAKKIGGVFPGQTGVEVARELADSIIALLPKDEWRTMESAPRDGTVVLVAHAINGFIFTANWDAGAGGWVDGSTDAYDELVTYHPSHWQPLPAPPTLISQQEAERD